MLQVIHSPFLQALGYAIINSLWQFAILWLAYVFANTIFKLSSHQRYVAGFVLQTAGFLWFSATLFFYFKKYSSSYEDLSLLMQPAVAYTGGNKTTTVLEKLFLWIMQTEKLLPYLSVAYLTILVFITWKWLQAYWFTQAVRTKGLQKIEVKWRLFVQQLSLHLGINADIKIYLSELADCPLTIGFFKPIILIPLASINHLNTEQMEAVILHELAHIKRFDYLFNLFLVIIETALFFNPFMQLISGHIKRERENCCDDRVLQFNYNAASYARALLQIATSQFSAPAFALKAADDRQVLLSRIKRMIEKKEKPFFNYHYQLLALLLLTVAVSSLALLSPSYKVTNTLSAKKGNFKTIGAKINSGISPSLYPAFAYKIIAENKEKLPVKHLQKKLTVFPIINTNTGKDNNENNNESNAICDEPTTSFPPAENNVSSFENNLATIAEKNIEKANTDLNSINFLKPDINNNEIRAAEKKIRRLVAVLFKVKKLSVNQEQLANQMQLALDQMKASKIQLESTKPALLIDAQIRETETANVLAILSNPVTFKPAIIKLLTIQINKEIEKVKQQTIRYTNSDSDYNFTFSLPNQLVPVPPPPDVHNYSYKISRRSNLKISPSIIRGKSDAGIQHKIAQEEDELIPENTESPAANKPMKYKSGFHSSYSIRI